jgi:acyl carrier protein
MTVQEDKQIIAKINKLLSCDFEIKKELIRPESELVRDLEIDSLDFIDFIVSIQRNFGIKISGEDLLRIKTVEDMYKFILKKKTE